MRVIVQMASSLVIAFATYSRIPMPRVDWSEENRRYSLCFFPIIGLVIGAALCGWLWLCDALGIGAMLRGCVGALIPLLITGGIHMDGFMDTCDALASWQPKERRLEILGDSHIGAFAVIGCCAYLMIAAGLLSEMTMDQALPLAFCFAASRAASAVTSVCLKSAKSDGMLRSFTASAQRRAVLISSCGYFVLCLCIWLHASLAMAFLCALAALTCVLVYKRMAYTHFGGVTGDLAGWLLQVTELALIAVVVMGGKIV